MTLSQSELLQHLQAAFQEEAAERLELLSGLLLDLEQERSGTKPDQLLEAVNRHTHSLKGAARAVARTDIETICQALESLFATWRQPELVPTPNQFDLLHKIIVLLKSMVQASPGEEIPPTETVQKLFDLVSGTDSGQDLTPPAPVEASAKALPETPPATPPTVPGQPEPSASPAEPGKVTSDTIRLSTSALDRVLLKTEGLVGLKLQAEQWSRGTQALQQSIRNWRRETRRLTAARRLVAEPAFQAAFPAGTPSRRALEHLAEYLPRHLDTLEDIDHQVTALGRQAARDHHTIRHQVDLLLDELKTVRLFPARSLLAVLPVMVRDLSRSLGKEVHLELQGAETRLDRRILEELKTPLIHLVRNAVDHGIETGDRREEAGKPRAGTITVALSLQDNNRVMLTVRDDGAGLDAEQLKAAALEQQIITSVQARSLSVEDLVRLCFQSGVSTQTLITDISGRGLGLAIVRESVEKLGGHLIVETQPGLGTTFSIHLPQSLSTFRGITVRTGDRQVMVSTAAVIRILRLPRDSIQMVENRPTISWKKQTWSFAWLHEALDIPLPAGATQTARVTVLITGSGSQQIAFGVQTVIDEREVLLKSLGSQLQKIPNFTAATVLSSGELIPVLNVSDLVRSAIRRAKTGGAGQSPETGTQDRHQILVVEDSVTSRMLLKSILESAGYQVETAVDGQAAFNALCTGKFNLVVSDVDMPRMNGFVLTTRIRQDERLSRIPVVLVTALASREDQERGLDAGANAYIVKTSFDQSNLLQVIKSLL